MLHAVLNLAADFLHIQALLDQPAGIDGLKTRADADIERIDHPAVKVWKLLRRQTHGVARARQRARDGHSDHMLVARLLDAAQRIAHGINAGQGGMRHLLLQPVVYLLRRDIHLVGILAIMIDHAHGHNIHLILLHQLLRHVGAGIGHNSNFLRVHAFTSSSCRCGAA